MASLKRTLSTLQVFLISTILVAHPTYAAGIRLYTEENYAGSSRVFLSAKPAVQAAVAIGARSAKVATNPWLLCDTRGYRGDCLWLWRKVPSFRKLAFDGPVGSLRPVQEPIVARQWGKRGPPPRDAIAFFPEPDYKGEWIGIRRSIRKFEAPPHPGSIVVRTGAWRVCTEPNFGGRCLSMTTSAWDLADIFTSDIESVEILH